MSLHPTDRKHGYLIYILIIYSMSLVNRNEIQINFKIILLFYVFITIEIWNVYIDLLIILISIRNRCFINLLNI